MVQNLSEKNRELKAEVERLELTSRQLEDQHKVDMEQYVKMNDENCQHKEQIRGLQADYRNACSQNIQQLETIAALESRIESRDEYISKMTVAMGELSEKVKELEEENSQLLHTQGRITQDYQDLRIAYSELERENAELAAANHVKGILSKAQESVIQRTTAERLLQTVETHAPSECSCGDVDHCTCGYKDFQDCISAIRAEFGEKEVQCKTLF